MNETDNSIKENSMRFVEELFNRSLTKDYYYHDIEHTRTVLKYCTLFGENLQLTPKEMEMLEIAAIFHDTGYTKVYNGHEDASMKIAEEFLTSHKYLAEDIEIVKRLIKSTTPSDEPHDLLERIIKDADMSNLGRTDFMEAGNNLRHEWSVFLDEHYEDVAWYEDSLQFLNQHEYYTDPARQLFEKQKKSNLKKVKKLLKKERKNMSKKEDQGTIRGSRSAQMMFKTALRNHIDLTNIADNKANMMLSINAIVISISIPMLASNIQDNFYLLVPAGFLLTTCVLSIIFATLATRPIKMNGRTNFDHIPSGNTNLFFFGNFYNLPITEYRVGIKEVMKEDDLLEATIVNDLFYLGKALGNKYNRLRTCYAVFMVGITLTVIAFAISFMGSLN